MKMPMVRADEDVIKTVDMYNYVFYLSSVRRMVSVNTQRVETVPVKCNSITKGPPAGLAPGGLEFGHSFCFS